MIGEVVPHNLAVVRSAPDSMRESQTLRLEGLDDRQGRASLAEGREEVTETLLDLPVRIQIHPALRPIDPELREGGSASVSSRLTDLHVEAERRPGAKHARVQVVDVGQERDERALDARVVGRLEVDGDGPVGLLPEHAGQV